MQDERERYSVTLGSSQHLTNIMDHEKLYTANGRRVAEEIKRGEFTLLVEWQLQANDCRVQLDYAPISGSNFECSDMSDPLIAMIPCQCRSWIEFW